MKKLITSSSILVLLSIIILVFASGATAVPVDWTDWTSTTSVAPGVVGTISTGSDTIGVTYSGLYAFAQTAGGTNYWLPTLTYTNSVVDNAPPASDIIALNTGGTATITFNQAVTNPILAFDSWNGNVVNFSAPINILGYGPSTYWGTGSPINITATGFTGLGEFSGTIQLEGIFTSFTFTHTTENWHGFTVGLPGAASVPEPATLLLLGAGLIGLAGYRRKKLN